MNPVTSTSDRPPVALTTYEQVRIERQLAVVTILSRLALVASLLLIEGSVQELSRDSAQYDARARSIAETQYATGNIHWELWLDHGWQQLLGGIYYLFGPHLILILALNCLLVSMAVIVVFRIGLEVFRSVEVARTSAYLFSLFPSVVYYTSLPLKEAPAVLALSLIVWGTVQLKVGRRKMGFVNLVCGLAVIAMLRLYLVYICGVCVAVCLLPINLRGGLVGFLRLGACGVALVAGIGLLAHQAEITPDDHESLKYFDLDNLNEVRLTLSSSGKARFFNFEHEEQESAVFGQSAANDATLVTKGLFFYLFSIDLFNLKRVRQMAAIPEMLFFLYCVPCLYSGVADSWRRFPHRVVPVMLMLLALVTVYSSATTNMGAMYRWRMQSLPFLMMLITYGAAVRHRGILHDVLKRFAYRSPVAEAQR